MEEKHLIQRIKDGDKPCFKILVEKYQRLVYHIVYRMIHNESDIQDVCQDIFIKVFQNIQHFRFECKLSTWIGRISVNTCLNFIKKMKPVFSDNIETIADINDTLKNQLLPDEIIEKEERSKIIEHEIRKLKPQYKAILTLYHLEEMRYEEIGQIMQLPEGTVKSYLFRARKELKQKMMKHYKIEELLS